MAIDVSDTALPPPGLRAQRCRSVPLSLAALALGNFAVGTGALMIAGLVPEIASELYVSPSLAAQLITIYALVYTVSAPILSVALSAIDRRRVLVWAMLGLAVTNFAAALLTDFGTLMGTRGVSAVFASIFTPVSAAVASVIVPRDKIAGAISIVFGGLAISTVIGVPLGALLGGIYGWTIAFFMVSGLAILAAILCWYSLADGLETTSTSFADLATILRDWPAMKVISVTTLQITSQFIPFSFAGLILTQTLGAGPTGIFWLLMVFGIFSVAGNFLGGWLGDRIGTNRTVGIGLFLLPFPLFALSFLSIGWTVAGVVMAIWGLIGFSFNAPQQARLIAMRPLARNMVLALNASALYLGTTLGTVIGGGAVSGIGVWSLPYLAATASIVTIVVFLISRAPARSAAL